VPSAPAIAPADWRSADGSVLGVSGAAGAVVPAGAVPGAAAPVDVFDPTLPTEERIELFIAWDCIGDS
jgi:hypothetical protein